MGAGFAIASLVLTAVSTGVSAYSQYQQGKTEEKVAEYNARVEKNRAIQAQMDANAAAKAKRMDAEKLQRRQRALYAKAGVQGGAGTPLEVMVDTATELELEALEIERSGATRAQQHTDQSAWDRYGGKQAARAGAISAGATLLQGASSIGSSYVGFKQSGAIKG